MKGRNNNKAKNNNQSHKRIRTARIFIDAKTLYILNNK